MRRLRDYYDSWTCRAADALIERIDRGEEPTLKIVAWVQHRIERWLMEIPPPEEETS